jgi:uncharacterized membrane protein YbhN (UPF0104 family)
VSGRPETRFHGLARWLLASRWLRIGAVVATVCFLTIAVVNERSRIGPRLSQITPESLAVGLLATVAGLLATMLSWRTVVGDLGSKLSLRAAARVFFAGQLGKYMPGSVWPVLMQMELGVQMNVPRALSVAATMVQIGLTVATGTLLVIVLLPFIIKGAPADIVVWLPVVAILLAVALHPRVANPMLRTAFKVCRIEWSDYALSGRGILISSFWQIVAWMLLAVPVILLSRDVGSPGARIIAVGAGAFALSWIAGFLIVVAPAGAGVREGVMTAILSVIISPASALTVALVSRLIMTAGDVLLGGAAIAFIGRDRVLRRRATYRNIPPDDG